MHTYDAANYKSDVVKDECSLCQCCNRFLRLLIYLVFLVVYPFLRNLLFSLILCNWFPETKINAGHCTKMSTENPSMKHEVELEIWE